MRNFFITVCVLSFFVLASNPVNAEKLDAQKLKILGSKLIENGQRYGTVSQSIVVKKRNDLLRFIEGIVAGKAFCLDLFPNGLTSIYKC